MNKTVFHRIPDFPDSSSFDRWLERNVPETLSPHIDSLYRQTILAIQTYYTDASIRNHKLFVVQNSMEVRAFRACFYQYDNPIHTMEKYLKNEIALAVTYKDRCLSVQENLDKTIQSLGLKPPEIEARWHFVTIGFDDKTFTIEKMKKVVEYIKTQPFFKLETFVCEKHRKDAKGDIYIHHHIHMIIYADLSPSQIAQKLYKVNCIKNAISGSNFIDCVDAKKAFKIKKSPDIETYRKYIKGDKQKDKLECIELDAKWRYMNDL